MYSLKSYIRKHQAVERFFYKFEKDSWEESQKKAITARFVAANVQSRIDTVHPADLGQLHCQIYPVLQTEHL